MSNSQFCIQQRQKEQQKTKRLLLFGLSSSALLHGILAWTMGNWSIESPKAAEPIELIIVDKPKPQPLLEPKIESKPIVEPEAQPLPEPEPIKAKTPPPPVTPPEPINAQTAPPKPTPVPVNEPQPIPKKVLTTPTPTASQPIISAPIANNSRSSSLSNSFTAPSSSVTSSTSSQGASNNPGMPGSPVATNSAPPRPESNSNEGISCISNCKPEYPAALAGVEGSAGVKLTINADGNVIGAELTSANSNSQVNRQALLAARQMQFSSPGNSSASVRVKIEFTVAGSEYDRAAREAQARREQAEKERQEQEAARQQQLEQERQARQEQLERERQARQQQLQQQQESAPPTVDTQPAPKPLPDLLDNKVDDEMLRKFRERIEQHQGE